MTSFTPYRCAHHRHLTPIRVETKAGTGPLEGYPAMPNHIPGHSSAMDPCLVIVGWGSQDPLFLPIA
jgi:hypothetical protein